MTATLPTAAERLAALESLDDIVISVDRELRVTSWNAAAERLMDRPSAGAIGAAIMTMVTPGLRLSMGHLLERALAGDTIGRQDLALMRRDGSEVAVSLAIAPIRDASGGVAGLVLLGHDAGAQQRLQYQLLQSKRMESTGQLAAGVAHEFNNILTAILALSDFAGRALPGDSPARADIDGIREQATKGSRLVRHLMAFSRRQLLRTEAVPVGAVFHELEPLLQRMVSERILIATDADPETPPVLIDRAQLELVLLELVANAADAMAAGGTLAVDIRPRTVAGRDAGDAQPGSYVQVTLRDDGAGIDPAVRDRIFEPFFTTKGAGHSGLGLPMVEGVVTQHAGTISFVSDPGEGTTVTLLLPAAAAPLAAAAPAAPTVTEHGSNETVLVVEDESAVRAIICRALSARGYEVLEAKNGEDALLVAEQHKAPIHLVITDVVMPEMSGTELFHHLRRWYPRMRILFISGYAKGALPAEALAEGGGAGFLAKPFTIEQLHAEVRRMIQAPRKDS